MVVGAARARERKGRRVDGFMVMGLVGFRFVWVCQGVLCCRRFWCGQSLGTP